MKSQAMQDTVLLPQVDAAVTEILRLRGKQNPPARISVSFKAGAGDVSKHKINITPDNGPPPGDDAIVDVPAAIVDQAHLRHWLIRRTCHKFVPDEPDDTVNTIQVRVVPPREG